MKNTILALSQPLYNMEIEEATNKVYYDGELIAELVGDSMITSDNVTYYGQTEKEKTIVALSLDEQILKDYIESDFGYGFQPLQQFLVFVSETIDLFDVVDGVVLTEDVIEDIEEFETLNFVDDIVFYNGSEYQEITEELLNKFISEIYTAIVDYVKANNVI